VGGVTLILVYTGVRKEFGQNIVNWKMEKSTEV